MKAHKKFTDQPHGVHTFQRHVNGASIRIPRALAVQVVTDFVYQFSERPLRDCCHLRHAGWNSIAAMGIFELEQATMWINKLLEDASYHTPVCGRLVRLRQTLEALKADAAEFPDVTVGWEPPAITRPKRGLRH